VEWLLEREGVHFVRGRLTPIVEQLEHHVSPPGFVAATDADGSRIYANMHRGLIVTDFDLLPEHSTPLRGGILAEEMGLGKTVEIIDLICLHKRGLDTGRILASTSPGEIKPTNATLIITPNSLIQQWKKELKKHAPHLEVTIYTGLSSAKQSQEDYFQIRSLLSSDVVLTTYPTIAREIHYANEKPNRELRHAKKHKARRSPLVQISWWRVCLDEAQMVESGVSQAATVARLIPRCNAWAISGTPLRKDVKDLLGLLIFLQYEPYCRNKILWQSMDKTSFRDIFSTIALRHQKDSIRNELRLPPQKRIVITMPFTSIEEQNYSHLLQQMCDACGLDSKGGPVQDSYDPDSPTLYEKMREWLVRLRQTCLHPQVGTRNRRALGRGNGPLRTVAEVLEIMIEQNETAVYAEGRQMVMAHVMQGHIYGNTLSDRKFHLLHAQSKYDECETLAKPLLEDAESELDAELARVAQDEGPGQSHGKTQRGDGRASSTDDGEETDNESTAEEKGRLPVLRRIKRTIQEVWHLVLFFQGTTYFQLKSDESITKPDSERFRQLEEQETAKYEHAKQVRQAMLEAPRERAEGNMQKIKRKSRSKQLAAIPDIPVLDGAGGIENRKIIEKMDLLGDVLDKQKAQINEWRSQVIRLLTIPLVDKDEGLETTGDEYQDSTKAQDELYVYLQALRTLVADRSAFLTGQANFLINGEVKDAMRQAKDGEGHAPELMIKLIAERTKLHFKKDDESLRSVVTGLRSLATSLQWQADGGSARAGHEYLIVERQLKRVQAVSSEQVRVITDLEQELEMFRNVMNHRLEYYRQLQQISDTVRPYKEELDEEFDNLAMASVQRHTAHHEAVLKTLQTKRRFLQHLRSESTSDDSARICVICQCQFELGVLTVCGHQYCKECIRLWWSEHRTCPVCKRHLSSNDFHDITYKPRQLRAQEEARTTPSSPEKSEASSSPSNAPSRTSLYSDISATTLDSIKGIDLNGSYGTKIDTLSRHLIYLRDADPGAKTIIFSQYSDFLQVLGGAFRQFKIGYTAINSTNGIEKFKSDPSIECFLLDAKSDSSGLNLVNATHVFLCEPLINAAIELQAIARVHRIGQQRPTTVYMYLISDTVEEAIYEISVARRLEHLTRSTNRSRLATPVPGGSLLEKDIDKANSLELQQAPLSKLLVKGKTGGEVVEKDDLWNCLFGKKRVMGPGVTEEMQREVDRHLRVEAAEGRVAEALDAMDE